MIKTELFGTLKDGRRVDQYTLTNRKGESVQLLNYGAMIHTLNVLNNRGELADVVLGVANPEQLQGRGMKAAVFGRCANRIAYGRFELDGETIQLECNMGEHFIHGASGGYSRRLFTAEPDHERNRVTFSCYDEGEGGYGCAVDVAVTYTFTEESGLLLEYHMLPHGDTVLCPTNHAYFNLSGGDVREHALMLRAEKYAAKGPLGMPDGQTISVAETPLDFRQTKSIKSGLASDLSGFFSQSPPNYDDSVLLEGEGFRLAAELTSPAAGRGMQVYTDMPALVLYTPYCSEPQQGKGAAPYEGYCAVCLETQFVPNAVNCLAFQSPIFRKGEPLVSKTLFQFTTLP